MTYALDGGPLPTGLTLGADGGISGSPTGPGTTFTVRATNEAGITSQRTFRVSARPVLLGQRHLAGRRGGSGRHPPRGLGPQRPGLFTVRATDPDGGFIDRAYTLVAAAAPAFAGAEGLIGSYTIGDANFVAGIVTSDPAGLPVTLALRPGSRLPAGLTLNGATGSSTGTPGGPGTTFTVRATNSAGFFRDRTFRLNARPQMTTALALASYAQIPGQAYAGAVAATDPEGQALSWTVAAGVLPSTMVLNADGTFGGLPDASTTQVTLRATDPDGGFADLLLTFAPNLAPVWQMPASLPTATNESVFYTQTLAASGQGGSGVSYTVVSGTVPASLTLTASNGVLCGQTTAAPGTYAFTVRATDTFGRSTDRACSMRVNDRPTFTAGATTSFPATTTGTPVSRALAGTPTAAAAGTVTVVASDGIAPSTPRTFRFPTFVGDSRNSGTQLGFCIREAQIPPAGTTDTYTVEVIDTSPAIYGGGGIIETWQFQVAR